MAKGLGPLEWLESDFKRLEKPGVSKGYCLEFFEYLSASKKHSFVSPSMIR